MEDWHNESKLSVSVSMKDVLIVELNGYQGEDTEVVVSPESIFMIVDAKTGEELDNGYRSFEEAQEAWEEQNIINEGTWEE